MRSKFVITDNVRRTVAALGPFLAELEQGRAPATDRGLVLLEGRTGTGKTWACDWLAVQNHRLAVNVRAMRSWSVCWMLEDLAAALKLPVKQGVKINMAQIKEELRSRPRLLILDEGDRVLRRELLLETLRDVYDTTRSPMLLVSEGGGLGLLERQSPRCWRRTGQWVEYRPLTAGDVQTLWEDLAEIRASMKPEQAAQILELSKGGSFGEVMVNLEELERKLKSNPDAGLTDRVVDLALKARKAG